MKSVTDTLMMIFIVYLLSVYAKGKEALRQLYFTFRELEQLLSWLLRKYLQVILLS